MHQAGIIGDDKLAHGQNVDGLVKPGKATKISAGHCRLRRDGFANLKIFPRAQYPDRKVAFSQYFCKFREAGSGFCNKKLCKLSIDIVDVVIEPLSQKVHCLQ